MHTKTERSILLLLLVASALKEVQCAPKETQFKVQLTRRHCTGNFLWRQWWEEQAEKHFTPLLYQQSFLNFMKNIFSGKYRNLPALWQCNPVFNAHLLWSTLAIKGEELP